MAAEVTGLVICPESRLERLEAGAPECRQLVGGEEKCAQPDASIEVERRRGGRHLAEKRVGTRTQMQEDERLEARLLLLSDTPFSG